MEIARHLYESLDFIILKEMTHGWEKDIGYIIWN